MVSISKKAVYRIAGYIFRKYRNVKYIQYQNAYEEIDICRQSNHFRVVLPDTGAQLDERRSTKAKYNLRRSTRLLEEFCGGEIRFVNIDITSKDAVMYMDFYFAMKKIGYDIDYNMNNMEYASNYHVTDLYALIVGDRIASVMLTCEQCCKVYLENLTYDYDLAKYSPGAILYDYVLKELINKKKKEVYLLGGKYEYKRHYQSTEEIVFSGKILRPLPRLKLNMAKYELYLVIARAYRRIMEHIGNDEKSIKKEL